MGKGIEVGKLEACMEISEEPSLSGKKDQCQGPVGDEVGRWAGMLHFPGCVLGHKSYSLQKGKGLGRQMGLLCGPQWVGVGKKETAATSFSFYAVPFSSYVLQMGGKDPQDIFFPTSTLVHAHTHAHTHTDAYSHNSLKNDCFFHLSRTEKG